MQAQVCTMRHLPRTDRREQVQGTDNMDMQELRQDYVRGCCSGRRLLEEENGSHRANDP